MGISMVFISSLMAAAVAALAILFTGSSLLEAFGIYAIVGASLLTGWIAEMIYFEDPNQF